MKAPLNASLRVPTGSVKVTVMFIVTGHPPR